jgi:hypothetical protein
MQLIDRPLNRRVAVGGIAAVAVVSGAGATTPPPGTRSSDAGQRAIDLGPLRDNLGALLRMLASTDPRETVYNFAAGRVYACIAGRAPVPLFGTHSISAARGRAREDGTFVLRQHIVGFRTRFDTEDIIDAMTNPVTGEMVQLPLTDYGRYDSDYRADGTYALVGSAPRRISALGRRPWSESGGIVVMSDDTLQSAPGPMQPKVDVVTRYATVNDLTDPRVSSASSWFSFSAVDPFRPWLKMREPGLQLWHVYGRKVRSPGEMPAYIRRVAADRFPTLFNLPPF